MNRALLLIMVVFVSPFAFGYQFMNYGHDAFWNETAESGTAAGNGWSAGSYSSLQVFNGTASYQFATNAVTNSFNASTNTTNFNFTYAMYLPSATASGFQLFGLTAVSGDSCNANSKGVLIGPYSTQSSTNWATCFDGTYATTAKALSSGWSMIEMRKYGNNIEFYVNGESVKNGTSSNVGRYMYGAWSTTTVYFDDMHGWSGVLGSSVVLSGLNCTSCNPPYGDTIPPYLTSDTTPTFKFDTDQTAYCRIGVQNVNYSTLGGTRNCTSGEGASSNHICTLTSQDALGNESGYVYIACKTGTNQESTASSSGALAITGIATNPQAALDYGIHASVVWPQATVYTNQQVFLRDLSNNQVLATVDRVVAYGNQRWLLNYNNNTRLGLFNITPVVYSLELANLTYLQVETQVASFINSTKS